VIEVQPVVLVGSDGERFDTPSEKRSDKTSENRSSPDNKKGILKK
jgi:hypothetical protein